MRTTRVAVALGVTLAGTMGAAAAAFAAGSITPTNVPINAPQITVNFSGLPVLDVVFIQQCKVDGNASNALPFDQARDCSQGTSINPSTGAAGSGSAVFDLFVGAEPLKEEWNCDLGDTCYVRLAPVTAEATTSDEFFPFTFVAATQATTTTVAATTTTVAGATTTAPTASSAATTVVTPPTDVPEAPVNALLPLAAVSILGGGALMYTRKRRPNAA